MGGAEPAQYWEEELSNEYIGLSLLKICCMANSPFYQIILLGEAGVGKTSLFTRIFKNTFVGDKERVTIGLDYEDKVVKINDQDVQVRM